MYFYGMVVYIFLTLIEVLEYNEVIFIMQDTDSDIFNS
jgi:hypothetical protein